MLQIVQLEHVTNYTTRTMLQIIQLEHVTNCTTRTCY